MIVEQMPVNRINLIAIPNDALYVVGNVCAVIAKGTILYLPDGLEYGRGRLNVKHWDCLLNSQVKMEDGRSVIETIQMQ